MAGWKIKEGSWWAIQWAWDGWFNFPPGVHWDFKRRTNSTTGESYGPYVELHCLWFIVSVGRNPIAAY